MMKSRSFNSISISGDGLHVIKSSTNTEKLNREILFYKNSNVPLMANLVDYDKKSFWYSTEYVHGKTLCELLVENKSESDVWNYVFNTLDDSLLNPNHVVKDSNISTLKHIFIEKTKNRLKEIANLNDPDYLELLHVGATVGGKFYRGLMSNLEKSSKYLETLPVGVGVLHGDLCFSNIIYVDSPDKKLTLIDPRGGFDTSSVYGPLVYDIAKLAQSVYSSYDYVLYYEKPLIVKSKDEYEITELFPGANQKIESLLLKLAGNHGISRSTLILLAGIMLAGTPSFNLDNKSIALSLLVESNVLIETGML